MTEHVWLQCGVCGEDLFESGDDGLFYCDDEKVCPKCHTKCWIDLEEGSDYDEPDTVYVNWDPEHEACLCCGAKADEPCRCKP